MFNDTRVHKHTLPVGCKIFYIKIFLMIIEFTGMIPGMS